MFSLADHTQVTKIKLYVSGALCVYGCTPSVSGIGIKSYHWFCKTLSLMSLKYLNDNVRTIIQHIHVKVNPSKVKEKE